MTSFKVFNWTKKSETAFHANPSEPTAPYSRIGMAIDYCERNGYRKEMKTQPEGISYAEIQEIRDDKPTGNVWFISK